MQVASEGYEAYALYTMTLLLRAREPALRFRHRPFTADGFGTYAEQMPLRTELVGVTYKP